MANTFILYLYRAQQLKKLGMGAEATPWEINTSVPTSVFNFFFNLQALILHILFQQRQEK